MQPMATVRTSSLFRMLFLTWLCRHRIHCKVMTPLFMLGGTVIYATEWVLWAALEPFPAQSHPIHNAAVRPSPHDASPEPCLPLRVVRSAHGSRLTASGRLCASSECC